jgi:hypothetical protein
MTTIATDGKSMAGDGMAKDHCETIVDMKRQKVYRLSDGRIVGGAGNSFDLIAWRDWLEAGKSADCPIVSDQFAGLILTPDGAVYWVDHKGRELPIPPPCAVGSGQDVALGAMDFGAAPGEAVAIASRRDSHTGGKVSVINLEPKLEAVA